MESEKRPAEEDLSGFAAKKVKISYNLDAEMKKVAGMVLVLAGMGKMRGGREPSQAEKDLMAEARNRMAKVCLSFAPKDLFPVDAFGSVIEDLGLNKLKEQRLGFRPPKMSIAEKLLLSKKKMEKSEDFTLPSTLHTSQRVQVNSGSSVESRSALPAARTPLLDKASHVPLSSVGFQSALSPPNLTASTYQLPTSEVRPVMSNALPSSHLGSAALTRVERPHFRLDGRPSVSSQPSQGQAIYSANTTVRTPAWSVQSPVPSSKVGSENKVPANLSFKVEGTADVKPGLPSQTLAKPVNTPATVSPPSVNQHIQGMNRTAAPPVSNTHAEICKIIQKLLQPRVLERPAWNPPSRDYMNKASTCQLCTSTVTDTDNVLICDACEKGFHLKCLQTHQRSIPRGEWHCVKCLSLSHGKPLPPKYGRVMRNINTAKLASNKKVGASDEKVNQPKIIVNGNTSVKNMPSGSTGTNHLTSGLEIGNMGRVQGSDATPSTVKTGDKISLVACPSAAPLTPVNPSVERSHDVKLVEQKPQFPALCQAGGEVTTVKLSHEKCASERDPKEAFSQVTSDNIQNLENEQRTVQGNPRTSSAKGNGAMDQGRFSAGGLRAVDWVGGAVQVVGDKTYYESCCINGHVYKVKDHVLTRLGDGKIIPARLQAMWDDTNTSTKWVSVARCYFPGDLPEAVGRPCGLESSEVYESNYGTMMMACFIEGPCKVLPPRDYAEESERRSRLGSEASFGSQPLYLCKWIYDESKGLFRDVSC